MLTEVSCRALQSIHEPPRPEEFARQHGQTCRIVNHPGPGKASMAMPTPSNPNPATIFAARAVCLIALDTLPFWFSNSLTACRACRN